MDHILLGILDALADGLGNLGGLTGAEAHVPLLVANHHQGGELGHTTALDGLGYTVEIHELLAVLALLFFKSGHFVSSSR